MSKRSIRKVRHYKPAPTFKERMLAGQKSETKTLWEKHGFGTEAPTPTPEVVVEVHEHEHVHGPDCHHE